MPSQEQAQDASGAQTYQCASKEPSPARLGAHELPVHFQLRRRRRGGPWPLTPFRRRHPPRQVREVIGRADGTSVIIVDLFAIEAQTGHAQLHTSPV